MLPLPTSACASLLHRYEDAFEGGANPNFKFNAFTSTADPYERADDQALRFKWLQDAQILSGPFRPSGRVKGSAGQAASELPTRSTLPQMVAELREAIEFDWGEYAFLVCSTDDEHVVVRFELSTLDSEPGLGAYMNVFARSHHVVSKFMLRKVVEDWNGTHRTTRSAQQLPSCCARVVGSACDRPTHRACTRSHAG